MLPSRDERLTAVFISMNERYNAHPGVAATAIEA